LEGVLLVTRGLARRASGNAARVKGAAADAWRVETILANIAGTGGRRSRITSTDDPPVILAATIPKSLDRALREHAKATRRGRSELLAGAAVGGNGPRAFSS
jgi:hypothetical protein